MQKTPPIARQVWTFVAQFTRDAYIGCLHNVGEDPGDEAKSDQLGPLLIVQQIMGRENAFAGLSETGVCAGIEIDRPLINQLLIDAQNRQVLQHVESNGKR